MAGGKFRATLFRIIALALAVGFCSAWALPRAEAATAGSQADPLVTRSWLEDYVEQSFAPLRTRLDGLNARLPGQEIVLTIGSREAQVSGQPRQLATAPQIMGAGYTMVPARFIGEALGLQVEWDAPSRTVSFQGAQGQMALVIGSTQAHINGQAFTMPFAPVIADGHTLVHVRFISESFQCQVGWDPGTRQVSIRK